MRWLLVREHHDVVFDRTAWHVYVAELARCDWCVVTLCTHAPSLQATRQVRQRASVHQLADDRSASAGVATDDVDEAQTVEAKAGHIDVVHEVVVLQAQRVIFFPVTAHGQHLLSAAVDCHDVRLGQLIFLVVHTVNQHVNADLQQRVAVVVLDCVATLLSLFLLHVCGERLGVAEVNLTIEPGGHQLVHLVLCLTHHVGDALGGLDVRRTVGHHNIFCWQIHRDLTAQQRVEVHLLERATCEAQ